MLALATWILQAGVLGYPSPGCAGIFCDATRYYLPTFRGFLTTGQPTEGFLYPPFFALLGAPFGLLGDGGFVWAWAGVQLGALLLLALAPAGVLGRWALPYVALLGLSEPVLHNMVWGQVSVLLTGMVLAAFALERSGRPRWGAVVLGCAIAIKYYPAAFLAWWLVRRDWRFLAWTAGSAAVFSVLPLPILGPGDALAFLGGTGGELAFVTDRAPTVYLSQTWIMVLGRLGAYTELPALFALELWALPLLALLGGAAWAFVRAAHDDRALPAVALLWLAVPFAGGAVWPHYMVYFPFCQVVALWETRLLEGLARQLLGSLVIASMAATTWLALPVIGVAIHPAVGIPFFAGLVTMGALVGCAAHRSRMSPNAAPPGSGPGLVTRAHI